MMITRLSSVGRLAIAAIVVAATFGVTASASAAKQRHFSARQQGRARQLHRRPRTQSRHRRALSLQAPASGKILGMVPASRTSATSGLAAASFASTSTPNLAYYGGPVMRTNRTYAIYWTPTGSSLSGNYEPLINGFLANVSSASGTTTNVYSSDVQYSDSTGPIAYSSAFGGSFVDSSTPIPDDCSSQYAGTGMTVTGCVTDADIQAEVSHALAVTGWAPDAGSEFLVFTPANVGSCTSASSTTCAYSYYCAYHSSFTDSQAREVLYANLPYSDTSGIGAPGACDSGQHPNGDWADATISVLSHEHNESITDPLGNAWHDASGNENGDKCAWNFGASSGSTAYGQYNQTIGSGRYYLQQEWSNASSSCVLAYASTAPAISSFTPTGGAVKTAVTLTGANFTGASSVKFNGVSASFSVKSATTITTTVPTGATSGPITVTTTKGTATSKTAFLVPATVTGLSPTSGKVGTAVAISGTGFTGASAVRFNGVAASYTVVSATKISTTVPAGATTGRISVVTAAGTASSSSSFTVK